MPRLKVAEPVQHGPRHWEGPAKSIAKKAKQADNASSKTTKSQTFLTKDQQALLAVEYTELLRGSQARNNALVKLCKKWDVHLGYPSEMVRKLKETKELPSRDGVSRP